MPARNTTQSFGSIARSFHWLTALLILTAIPLGVIANQLPYDTAEALAIKAQLFSIHKTIGVAAFFVALGRILWALMETRPVPLHPDRKGELRLAEAVHWMLYISLLAVPLTGWVHHAALTGFAPILWPFGQTLPFVPQTAEMAAMAGAAHWVFTKLLALAIVLHVAGALKHHIVDKDSTLRRMTRGEAAPADPRHPPKSALPVAAAFALYALGAGIAGLLVPQGEAVQAAPAPVASAPPAAAGNWTVASGTLGFTVKQMGQDVQGQFGTWTADITFDEAATDGKHGKVTVTIDTGSMTLGSVTDQAKGADFFDSAAFPQAVFTADILPAATGYVAQGTLDLRGAKVPVALPFTLTIAGDTATMAGTAQLDRRDFAMGATYKDESTIGFGVAVTVALTATRAR